MAVKTESFDIAVIGGGPGGYVAAIRASQLGMKACVIEKDRLGGLCLNWGCIPSKALLRSAEVYRLIQEADAYGINVGTVKFDAKKIIKRSRNAAEQLSKGVAFLLKKNKVTHVQGAGVIKKPGVVEVSNNGKVETVAGAKHILVATGGFTRSLPGVEIDGKKVISSREALTLDKLPKSIIIIGGGPIGIEFAYFYNAFGVKCTIVEMMPHILPFEDKEIAQTLQRNFKKNKIEILTETRVEGVKTSGKGVTVTVSGKGGEKKLVGDLTLVAVGFGGLTEGIGLEDIGVQTEKSYIKVNDTYKTNVDGIYAIGDVIGPPLLAHVASAEGIFVVEKLAGHHPVPIDYGNIPGCTYCQPQVASVGLTEEKAIAAGHKLKIGRFPFRANGKSIAIGDTEGLVKLIFDEKYGELLGAHIIGSEATDMIAELGLARSLETTYTEVLKTVHAHPTLSEAVMEAAADALGEAIHI
ncbi:dihydrolipoyl dehydrogenase [candidate division KSB1 bacterium]|nr:dihydrolipoyl dehydrogenase [candidate division KSB1 bacterium]